MRCGPRLPEAGPRSMEQAESPNAGLPRPTVEAGVLAGPRRQDVRRRCWTTAWGWPKLRSRDQGAGRRRWSAGPEAEPRRLEPRRSKRGRRQSAKEAGSTVGYGLRPGLEVDRGTDPRHYALPVNLPLRKRWFASLRFCFGNRQRSMTATLGSSERRASNKPSKRAASAERRAASQQQAPVVAGSRRRGGGANGERQLG